MKLLKDNEELVRHADSNSEAPQDEAPELSMRSSRKRRSNTRGRRRYLRNKHQKRGRGKNEKQVPLLIILDSISSLLYSISSLLHWCVTLCAVHVVPLVVSSLQTIQEKLSIIQSYVLSVKTELQEKADPEQPEPHFSDCDIVPLEPEENDDKIEKEAPENFDVQDFKISPKYSGVPSKCAEAEKPDIQDEDSQLHNTAMGSFFQKRSSGTLNRINRTPNISVRLLLCLLVVSPCSAFPVCPSPSEVTFLIEPSRVNDYTVIHCQRPSQSSVQTCDMISWRAGTTNLSATDGYTFSFEEGSCISQISFYAELKDNNTEIICIVNYGGVCNCQSGDGVTILLERDQENESTSSTRADQRSFSSDPTNSTNRISSEAKTHGDSYTDGKVDRNDVTMTLNTTEPSINIPKWISAPIIVVVTFAAGLVVMAIILKLCWTRITNKTNYRKSADVPEHSAGDLRNGYHAITESLYRNTAHNTDGKPESSPVKLHVDKADSTNRKVVDTLPIEAEKEKLEEEISLKLPSDESMEDDTSKQAEKEKLKEDQSEIKDDSGDKLPSVESMEDDTYKQERGSDQENDSVKFAIGGISDGQEESYNQPEEEKENKFESSVEVTSTDNGDVPRPKHIISRQEASRANLRSSENPTTQNSEMILTKSHNEHVTKGANYSHVNKDVLPLDEKAVNDMGVFYQGHTIGSFNSLAEAEVDTEEKLNFF